MSSKANGKTAVITGASSGLGKVYADRFAGRGYNLLIVARRADRLEQIAKDIRQKHGVDVEIRQADLSIRKDLEAIAHYIETNDKITALVNNAGTATMAPALETSVERAQSMIDLNVTAVVRLTQAILPRLKKINEGVIVNIASILAFHAIPVSTVYSGGKADVYLFTRGLQQELEGSGIRIQVVCPAATATEIWDVAGLPLSNLPKETVMSVEDCVDAAMAGLQAGELVTFPSVEDMELFKTYEAARLNLFSATQSGKPASRYKI